MEVGDLAEVGAVRGGTVAPPGRPGVYGFRDAAEVRVVTAWLATPAGCTAAIDLEQVGPAGAWARVAARVGPGPLFAVRPAVRSAPA